MFQQQTEALRIDFINQNKNIEQAICTIVLNNLKFHINVAINQYSYQVIPVLYIGFESIQQQVQDEVKKLLDQILNEYYQNTDNSTKDKTKFHATLLIIAYLNLQLSKFDQSLVFLNDLEKYYNLERYDDQEQIKHIKNSNENDFQYITEVKNENYSIETKELLRYGFIESIYTFKALNYLYQNNLKQLEKQILLLQDIKQEIMQYKSSQQMQERLELHFKLFQIHYYFTQRQFENAKEILRSFKSQEIEEAILVFFNNTNKFFLRNLETIYYNLFSDDLFQIFTKLQELELQNLTKDHVHQLVKVFNLNPQNYNFGKVISSRIFRISHKYNQAYEQMCKMFEICVLTNTMFSESLELFFRYILLLPFLDEKVKNTKPKKYELIEKLASTNLSDIYRCRMINENKQEQNNLFISKISKKQNKKQIINEIALQMLISHRNVQKIYDIYLNENNQIVSVQKEQGDNLINHLKNKIIFYPTRLNYIQQILNAFFYIHSLNIIHSDLKLENIITVSENQDLIKVIDFGFSQVKLFNKYFTPIGTTKNYAPTEILDAFFSTFESDIFQIGKVMDNLIINLHQDDQIKKIQEIDQLQQSFLTSNQLKDLISSMTKKEIELRPSLMKVVSQFKFDFFTFKIFMQITNNVQYESFQYQQTEYQQFVDSLNIQFLGFISLFYRTDYLQSTSIKKWSVKYLNFDNQFNLESIRKAIANLIEREDWNFIDCLMHEHDIENFLKEICENQELKKQIELKIMNLQIKYRQEDTNSKRDILPEFQKEVIDKKFQITQLQSFDQKTKLEEIYRDVYTSISNQLDELLKEFDETISDEQEQEYQKQRVIISNYYQQLTNEFHSNENSLNIQVGPINGSQYFQNLSQNSSQLQEQIRLQHYNIVTNSYILKYRQNPQQENKINEQQQISYEIENKQQTQNQLNSSNDNQQTQNYSIHLYEIVSNNLEQDGGVMNECDQLNLQQTTKNDDCDKDNDNQGCC